MANPSPKRPSLQNWLLVASVIALGVVPVVFVRGEFSGSDQQGTEAIEKIRPSYKPWFKSVIVLPSKEIESLMFTTQAAVGAGVVGFVIGLYRGRSLAQERNRPPTP
jgi:cobalt/nickel transport protein